MNELVQGTKDEAIAFVNNVRSYLTDAAKSFFKIGYELHKAQEIVITIVLTIVGLIGGYVGGYAQGIEYAVRKKKDQEEKK